MSAPSSLSLDLSWTDRRPRPAWCGFCLLLLLALAEVAARGYGSWALAGIMLWLVVAALGMPPAAVSHRLRCAEGLWLLDRPGGALPLPIELLPGTVLLAPVVVLHWRPLGARGRRYLWVWRADIGEQAFRALRRWWIVTGSAQPAGSRPSRFRVRESGSPR